MPKFHCCYRPVEMREKYDAVIVGSGPNGLSAAITLARAGRSVLVLEAKATLGGGIRSEELTLPGFSHDLCSAVHPLAAASPCLTDLPLARHGLEWIEPPLAVAHPLDGGRAATLRRDLGATADALGKDGPAYRRLIEPLARHWPKLAPEILQPMLHLPRHPIALAQFGMRALWPARLLARSCFTDEAARALFAGIAAHSFLPLEALASSAAGLVLAAAGHRVGWPIPKGGSGAIAHALAAHLRELGGEILVDHPVERLDALPKSRLLLLDLTVWQFLKLAGARLPARYRARLERFRHAPGVFKIDYALSDPVPWQAAACREAGTVHVGGSLDEIAAAERATVRGEVSERPFVLVAQQSLFDPSRAPAGRQTLWTYCHVPFGCPADMTERIEQQIERFAPGFRDCILARHRMGPVDLGKKNANLTGGDINGGAGDLWQLIARPVPGAKPYRTPLPGIYLCSASTPPGGGVHGMCGYHAARTALADLER